MRGQPSLRRHALILGLFTAAGPIGIDLYLPAFPEIEHALATDAGHVQLSLVSYFVALAVGQLFIQIPNSPGLTRTTTPRS